jgi:tRNA modification GTPase
MYLSGEVQTDDLTYVSNARHIGLLNQALESISEVITGLEADMPIDILQIDMTKTWEILGEITGESVHDELINQLFSQFCLGK